MIFMKYCWKKKVRDNDEKLTKLIKWFWFFDIIENKEMQQYEMLFFEIIQVMKCNSLMKITIEMVSFTSI